MVTTNPILENIGGNSLAKMQDLAAQLRRDPAPVHDFAIGDPREETPKAIRDALINGLDPVSQYPTVKGQQATRDAIARWFARRHNVNVDANTQVLPTAGSKEAIFHVPFAVIDPTGPKRHVLYGDPGYPVYASGTRFAHGVPDAIALTSETGWRLSLANLDEQRLKRAAIVWVNYPHNPTGAIVDIGWYREQVAIARNYDLLLASDECYQEVYFDTPHPSVLEACDGDFTNVLAVVSLSKRSGMTGYRSGALAGDTAVIERLRQLRTSVGTASPDFVQAAATAAFNDQQHVDERRHVFAAKRAAMLRFLAEAGIEVSGSDATFYVWFRAPGGDDAAYATALLNERIIVSPGRAFGPNGAGWCRIALVPDLAGIAVAINAWRSALDAGRLPT